LLSFATIECGVSEESFWRLTPLKLSALVKAKQEDIKRDDYRTGVLAMIVRAALGVKNTHPFDFFPQHKEASRGKGRGIVSAEQVRANFRAYIEATQKNGQER
jgi:hypothetical protein